MTFGYSKSVRSSRVLPCSADVLNTLLDSRQVAVICAQIADAREKCQQGIITPDEYNTAKSDLKRRLPIITPHATFMNERRLNVEAVPSGLSMYDLDHIPDPRGRWAEIEPRKEELGILFAHITPSLEGLRLVFRIPYGMTLAEAQQWMASKLGDKVYDASVKDYARSSFLVPRDYVLWLSDKLFSEKEISSEECRSADNSFGNEENYSSADCADNADKNFTMQNKKQESASSVSSADEKSFPTHYENIPYEHIVEALAEQLGGVPEHGARNNFIFAMACHLRYVCNDDPRWIETVLPCYGEAQEKVSATIRSAVNRPQGRTMPSIMKRALENTRCRQKTGSARPLLRDTPPPMPKRLPPLISLLVANVPDHAQAAAAHAVFPALGAHLGGVKFRYIDNVEHEATFMCVLLAKMSSGKSAVNAPIDYILADIRERDAYNRQREQEWKDAVASKGANKEKPKRPEGLTVQVLSSDMTNAAFVQRLRDAEGKFLYTRMDEIELLDNLKTSGRGNQVSQIIRLAFDQGEYGQERVGAGSVTALAQVKWNWNASSTIQKGKWYFRNALTDGTLSRLNFCTMEPTRGGSIPLHGEYGEHYAEALKPYIDNLNAARGQVVCKQAEALAQTLLEENAERAVLSDDEAYEMLSYRANVIAYLKAMTLYVAHGEWMNEIEDFVRWSEEYDLWCKMHFFGDDLHDEMEKERIVVRRGPRNLLELLPDTFSKDDVVAIRRAQGMSADATWMLYAWCKRGYVTHDKEASTYTKTNKQKSK